MKYDSPTNMVAKKGSDDKAFVEIDEIYDFRHWSQNPSIQLSTVKLRTLWPFLT